VSDERSLRVAEAARRSNADFALLTSFDTVCYATGFEVPIETGPMPFEGGPPTALVARDGTTGLVVINIEEEAARAGYARVVVAYEGFSSVRRPPLRENYTRAVLELVAELGAGGTLAIEPASCPAALRDALEQRFAAFVDVDPALAELRTTKTREELDALRRCAELVVTGQAAALAAVRAGQSELEVFADVRCAMEVAHGGRMAITGDLVSGVERTAACEGWPNERRLEPGDPVIVDLSPRARGYWGDSCSTILVPGDSPEGFLELFDASLEAILHARSILRPGMSAGDLDREVREVVARRGFANPLHIGHGIGTSFHELPKIVAQETTTLVPDMVVMLEPGAYDPTRGGVRLEWMFRVTETGNEVMTPFEFVLRPG
jgi:Xaa-Pro aminopeptidase